MKNKGLWVVAGVAAVVVLGLAVPVINLFDGGQRVAGVQGDEELVHVSQILQRSCADCHSPEAAKMPFYAKLPPASGIIAADQREATRWWHLDAKKLTGEVALTAADLARIEIALASQEMPPAKYTFAHWRARLSAGEAQALRDFIAARRAQRPEAAKVAEKLRAEPVQPVILPADLNREKVALGERLYHEKRLSGDDTVSCASCHAMEKGATDQEAVSTGIGGQKGPINAPTTFNASYNVLQFWDGRARDLKDQAGGPVENPKEMGAKFADVVTKLAGDESYVQAFQATYGAQGISKATITDAIAEYERSLVTPNAPFDKYLMGDEGAIDESAKQGYALFKATGCTACHNGPALGGGSFERMGVAEDYFAARGNVADADQGRFNVTHDERDRHVFKVPTLRNVEVTHPYFHDGSAKTLEDAVRTMAKYERGKTLSDAEVGQLVAFLKSLTGEYDGKPVTKL